MRNHKARRMILAVLSLAVLLPAAGCSAQRAPAAAYEGGTRSAAADMAYQAVESPEAESSIAGDGLERKLAKRANLHIRVADIDAVDAAVMGLMERHGAYAASSSIDENSRNYSIRVPSAAYGAFLDGMNGMGKMLHRSESAEDVTLHYYDLEGRLSTKRELLKTYQAYLGKAQNIEEILAVEARIAELHYEIDGTGDELRNLANRVDYAAVELYVIGPAAAEPYRGPDLGERMEELFRNFRHFLAAAVVALTGVVIYGIPAALAVVCLCWLLFGKIGILKNLWRAAMGKRIHK